MLRHQLEMLPNQFCHVERLAVDKFDNFYVTDPQSDPGCRMKPVSQDLIAMVTLLHNGNFLGYKLESVI